MGRSGRSDDDHDGAAGAEADDTSSVASGRPRNNPFARSNTNSTAQVPLREPEEADPVLNSDDSSEANDSDHDDRNDAVDSDSVGGDPQDVWLDSDLDDDDTDGVSYVADSVAMEVAPSGVGLVANSVDVWTVETDYSANSVADPVDELRIKLETLQRSVDSLTQRPTPEPIEAEYVGATRTLRYAQQTADAILDDARSQAAELVAEAERQRSEIIRSAREQAERDYGAERDRVRAEAAGWEARRAELVSEMASLSAVIGRYHDGLRALEDRLDLTAESLGGSAPVDFNAEPDAPQP